MKYLITELIHKTSILVLVGDAGKLAFYMEKN